jgi:hypothetical protein
MCDKCGLLFCFHIEILSSACALFFTSLCTFYPCLAAINRPYTNGNVRAKTGNGRAQRLDEKED